MLLLVFHLQMKVVVVSSSTQFWGGFLVNSNSVFSILADIRNAEKPSSEQEELLIPAHSHKVLSQN